MFVKLITKTFLKSAKLSFEERKQKQANISIYCQTIWLQTL